MKKTVVSIIIVLTSILLIAALLSGCGGSGNESDIPEFVYLPDVLPVPMPEGVDWIDNITVSGDIVYFTAMADWTGNESFTLFDIYMMDMNVSDIRKLPNYNVGQDFPADSEGGSVQIYSVYIDNHDYIWIAERGEFFIYDLPDDFDGDDWERWYMREIIHDFTRIRKLDDSGTEIASFDISHISAGREWFYVQDLIVDDAGNIYVGVESSIHVFNNEGKTLFTLDVNWIDGFVKMQDGSVAHPDWREKGRVLLKIDVAEKSWGESVELPSNAYNIYQGNEDYTFIFSDGSGLHGVEESSGDVVSLVNWIESDLTTDGLRNIMFLPDGRILITSQFWDHDSARNELVFLTKTPYSELPERTVLTLAAFYLDWNIRSVIVQFNRESLTHRIRVTDYAEFNTDDDREAGLTRLSAEIISGSVPDILDVTNLPFNRYAAKDLLIDLYDLIDSDPQFSRSDFMENVLRTTEINGGLYRIFPFYSIGTLAGNPSVVGSYPGWNMNEFTAVLEANPNADHVMGQGLTKENFLQVLVMLNMDNFVDWNTGTVNFDGGDFSDLLMYANTFPDEYDWNDEYISEHILIREGRQILVAMGFNSFDEYQMYRALFGGDIVFKGFPNENRNGFSLITNSSFAITNKCKDVNGAWEFLRMFMTEEWQGNNSWYGLPTNKAVFDKMLKDAMTEDEYGTRSMGWNDMEIELKTLTQADADQILALIDSVSGSAGQDEALWNIIRENATDYFSGRSSLQDAVRVIQNRASTFVAEQS